MSTDNFIHPVIMVPGPGGEDSIYNMARPDDTLMSNYLRTAKYGSYIYSVTMSMMVAGRQDPSGKEGRPGQDKAGEGEAVLEHGRPAGQG